MAAARRALTASSLALVVGLAIAACGGGGDGEPSPAAGGVGKAALATSHRAGDLVQGSGGGARSDVGEPSTEDVLPTPPAGVGSRRRRCSGGRLDPSQKNLAQIARATLCLLNAERRSRGLPRLRASRRLQRPALAHARDMVRRSYFAHNSRSGATFMDRIRRAGYLRGAREWITGENLAWGSGRRSRPREIIEAWMRSPGHRANILQPRFQEVGIGVVLGAPVPRSAVPSATYGTDFGARRPR